MASRRTKSSHGISLAVQAYPVGAIPGQANKCACTYA